MNDDDVLNYLLDMAAINNAGISSEKMMAPKTIPKGVLSSIESSELKMDDKVTIISGMNSNVEYNITVADLLRGMMRLKKENPEEFK